PWHAAQWRTYRSRPTATSPRSALARAGSTARVSATPPRQQPRAAAAATNPRRMTRPLTLLLDQLLPAPEVAVSDGAVQIDDALLEALEQLEVQRAIVDDLAQLEADPGPEERDEVGERIHQAVDASADPVADRHRLHERHDEVRAGAHPPDSERLPEVFAALLDPPVLRRIEQSPDAERAVDHEARDLAGRAAPFRLQEAVDHPGHERDVVEPVGDHQLERVGHDHTVDLRDRLEHEPVGLPIELEHLLVEPLPGVVVLVVTRQPSGLPGLLVLGLLLLGRRLRLGERRLGSPVSAVADNRDEDRGLGRPVDGPGRRVRRARALRRSRNPARRLRRGDQRRPPPYPPPRPPPRRAPPPQSPPSTAPWRSAAGRSGPAARRRTPPLRTMRRWDDGGTRANHVLYS